MKSWWNDAKIEDAVSAWGPLAGGGRVHEVDARFRAALWQVGPAEMALIMGYRLACRHGHGAASCVPGSFAAIWALRAGWPRQWSPEDPDRLGIGISSIASHATGTGRLRWEAKNDGTLTIEVWRGPSAGSDPSLVLSAVIRASPRNDDYNDGIECECVEVEAHTPFGVRHVEVLIGAIAMAMANDYTSFEHEAIRARIAALGTPEPDPWDPVNAPTVPPVGTRVRVVSEEIDHSYDARVTGAEAEWEPSHRDWALLVEDDDGWERRPLVREIRPAPEPEVEPPDA